MLESTETKDGLQEQESKELSSFRIQDNPFLKEDRSKDKTGKEGKGEDSIEEKFGSKGDSKSFGKKEGLGQKKNLRKMETLGKKETKGTRESNHQHSVQRKLHFRRQQRLMDKERKAQNLLVTLVRKIQEIFMRHTVAVLIITAILAMMVTVIVLLFLILGFFSDSSSSLIYGSYNSKPVELDSADADLTSKELSLQRTIDNIETDHPGFDEYRYNLDSIGHDPTTLINFLSAIHGEFTASQVAG